MVGPSLPRIVVLGEVSLTSDRKMQMASTLYRAKVAATKSQKSASPALHLNSN
jgi:hypothetical protein